MTSEPFKTLHLVSCVSRKQDHPLAARDLYCSDWFRKARAYVDRGNGPWRILSAEHGLVDPDAVIAPYERTLNRMGVADRKQWAKKVLDDLRPLLNGIDRVVLLAGERYREFLIDDIRAVVPDVEIPMEGLGIGQQLAWLKQQLDQPSIGHMSRLNELKRFYRIMDRLEQKLGGKKSLSQCSGKQDWPARGVYFFFEDSEQRTESGDGPRVVRVGTHALKAGSKATLWKRLSRHQGVKKTGGGNHRGSIFRLLIGQAMGKREGKELATWGVGDSAGVAATRLEMTRDDLAATEFPREREVTEIIGAMPYLWLDVPDAPGPDSLRGYLERNAIALLSNYEKAVLDAPSRTWLGQFSNREKVRRSGLWNSNHVEENYDPAFLDVFEEQMEKC